MGAQLEIRRRVDLKRGTIKMEVLDGTMFSADIRGNVFCIEVYDDGQPFNVGSHAVYANFILSDNTTIRVTSSTADAGVTSEGNVVTVPVPYDAYLVPGMMDVVIKIRRMESGVAANETKTTIAAFRAYVQRSSSGHEVTPTREIVDVDAVDQKLDGIDDTLEMTVTASKLAHTANPTATLNKNVHPYNLAFGIPGGTPATVSSAAYAYQNSSSGNTIPTGTWLDQQPDTPQGQFLWTRTRITWNNNSTTNLYSVSRQGIDGTAPGSVRTVNGISPDSNYNVTLPKDTEPFSSSANPITSGGVYLERPVIVSMSAISGTSDETTTITRNHASIKSTMRPVECRFSNPKAVLSDVRISTADGSITIEGTFSGTTTVFVTLANFRSQITPT